MRDLVQMRDWLIEQSLEKSVRQLAREIGIDHSTIHRIMDGTITDSKRSTTEKIINAMGKKVEEPVYMQGTDYVALVVDDIKETVQINTSIEDKDKALQFLAIAICKLSASEGYTENMLIGLVDSTYHALQRMNKR